MSTHHFQLFQTILAGVVHCARDANIPGHLYSRYMPLVNVCALFVDICFLIGPFISIYICFYLLVSLEASGKAHIMNFEANVYQLMTTRYINIRSHKCVNVLICICGPDPKAHLCSLFLFSNICDKQREIATLWLIQTIKPTIPATQRFRSVDQFIS